MGKKHGKQPATSSSSGHSDRPAGTSILSQAATANPGSTLTQFSSSGRLFAQLNLAVDADTVRVYEVQSGQCVGRWTSASAAERASALAWVELPSSSSLDPAAAANNHNAGGGEKATARHKRRRRTSSSQVDGEGEAEDEEGGNQQDSSTNAVAGPSSTSTSTSAATAGPLFEALSIGLKSGSIVILHPTQSTILQTLSHPSITSSVSALSYPTSSSRTTSSSSFVGSRHILWTSSPTGQISAWSLPTLGGRKGRLLAQYDTQNSGCSSLNVRYELSSSSKKAQPNGAAGKGASQRPVKVYFVLGQYSIKTFETVLPSASASSSSSSSSSTKLESHVERPKTTLLSQCSGHATEISHLEWVANPKLPAGAEDDGSETGMPPHLYFLSIAKGDRYLSLWAAPIPVDTTGFGAPASPGLLLGTLGLDDEPRTLALGGDQSLVAAVSPDAVRIISLSNSLFIHRDASAGPAKIRKHRQSEIKTLDIVSTITSTQASGGCLDVLLSDGTSGAAIVAVGNIKPQLERVRFKDDTQAYVSLAELQSNSKTALAAINGQVGDFQTSRVKYSEPAQSAVLSAEATGDLGDSSKLDDELVDPAAEPTIAERLKALDVGEQRTVSAGPASTTVTRNNRSRNGRRHGNVGAQTLSVTQSLVQALHSADVKLLESCLAESDPRVIRATTLRVPNTLVLPLVEALVERLSRTRRGVGEGTGGVDASRGQVLAEWLRNVLVVHLSYLITIPSLVDRLASLHATLEARGSFHSQLLALSGRLDLVVSQIDVRTQMHQGVSKSSKKSTGAAKQKAYVPRTNAVNKYVEGQEESDSGDSSSEEEDEDNAQSGHIMQAEPAEEGDEEDIEDLVMTNGDLGVNGGEITDPETSEDEEEEDDDETDIPAMRRTKPKAGKPRVNGFLDLEAEESENEGSDEEGRPIPKRKGVKLNGIINEESLDEDDEEDQDQYESDFINDDSEDEDEEESGEDDDEEDEDGVDED